MLVLVLVLVLMVVTARSRRRRHAPARRRASRVHRRHLAEAARPTSSTCLTLSVMALKELTENSSAASGRHRPHAQPVRTVGLRCRGRRKPDADGARGARARTVSVAVRTAGRRALRVVRVRW